MLLCMCCLLFYRGGGVGEGYLLFSNYVSWKTGRDSVSSHSYMGELRAARAKGDVTPDDSYRRFLGAVQHSAAMNSAAAIWNNVATMLQCCVALKIVVANRPVYTKVIRKREVAEKIKRQSNISIDR